MVFKRSLSSEDKNDNPQSYHHQATLQKRNQRLKYTKCQCRGKFWLQEYTAELENLIRKVVREEVAQVIQHSHNSISRPLASQANKPCESRKFKLQFEGKLPPKLFTGNNVGAEGPSPIKLFLVDAVSGHRVTEGPLSSIKVRIVVLHGHFKAEEQETWTQHEFNSNIVSERDGKRPLLVGDVVVALQNGMGSIGDMSLTDNSSWERTKMFRLGAKVEAKQDLVLEAVSSPFEVKDRRGEPYQKHQIPSPEDEVWRLCWIAKDGKICRRLAEHHIFKVKEFVTQYHLDKSLLRQILDVPPKKWEAIVGRALSCFTSHSSECPNRPNDPAPSNISISSTICPLTNLDLNYQEFCMPPLCHDQQENQVLHNPDNFHQINQSMNLNDSLLEDLVAKSCNDVHYSTLNDYMLPPFPTMLNYETSSWCPVAQLNEGNNFFMGSSSYADIGMPTSNSSASVDESELAETKQGLGKVRSIWKILVEHDEAVVKKGKFPRYSQQQAACP